MVSVVLPLDAANTPAGLQPRCITLGVNKLHHIRICTLATKFCWQVLQLYSYT